MKSNGAFTRAEILSEPEVWADSLKQFEAYRPELQNLLAHNTYENVYFTGCGSTYYLAQAAAALFQQLTGINSAGMPASEILWYAASAYRTGRRNLLVAVSRSGETTETIHAVRAFQQRGDGDVITFTCYPGRELAEMGCINLLFPAAQEESMAQTRSFSAIYLATAAFAALAAGREDLLEAIRRVPAACGKLLERYAPLAKELGADPRFERFYFLGSGIRHGLAREVALKMKEMSLSHSEPFHFMEFRHGPQTMANENTLMIGLVSEENREQEMAVLNEMAALGARVVAIAERDADVDFNSGLPGEASAALYLPVLQLMALEHALARDLDPDMPKNLVPVIKLSL